MLQNCCVTTRQQYVIIINFVYTVFHIILMISKCSQRIKMQKWCSIQKVLQLRRATVYLKGYVIFLAFTQMSWNRHFIEREIRSCITCASRCDQLGFAACTVAFSGVGCHGYWVCGLCLQLSDDHFLKWCRTLVGAHGYKQRIDVGSSVSSQWMQQKHQHTLKKYQITGRSRAG